MKKSTLKMLSILLIAILVIASVFTIVIAGEQSFTANNVSPRKMYDNAKDSTGASSAANTIIGTIITVVQVIGVGVAIIMLIVLAIKYISAAPGDKAEIKKHAVVYVVGAIVLFAASGILGIIKNLSKAFTEAMPDS